jgi:flagellar biosynthesis protein FliR
MPANLTLSTSTLYGFMLTLARVGGALAFTPIPGVTAAPAQARVALAAALALALQARWPAVDGAAGLADLVGWALAEAAVGIAIGLAAAFTLDVFAMAAQMFGLPAGFSYASTIDPFSQADSGVLVVFAQLGSGMLFFAMGFDREVVRLFAHSLEALPPGTWPARGLSAQPLIGLGGALFAAGLRLALPLIALMLMLDLTLALLGRLNQQLQLLSLSFPIKMLATLVALAWITPLVPKVMTQFGNLAWAAARRALGI